MAAMFVVDTHAILWFLEGNPKLGPGAKAALDDPASKIALPAIVLAEACWLIERGRAHVPVAAQFFAAVDADPRIEVVPLDRAVIERTVGMSAVGEMHDRQIVATALHLIAAGHAATVLTRDANITTCGLVPVLW